MTMWHSSGPSGSPAAFGPVSRRRVGGHVLAGGGARQEAEQRRQIVERGHDLVDRGEHDVRFRQLRREVAVAFVGDDDGRARLCNQEVGARDADVGGQEAAAQDGARFRDEAFGRREVAAGGEVRVVAAEVGFDLMLAQVDGRRDDVARRFAADLEQVFAEIAFEDFDPQVFEMAVEADLLGNHRLAFGDLARATLAAEAGDDGASFFAVGRPVHAAAGGFGFGGEGFEVDVEVRERVVADIASFVAQAPRTPACAPWRRRAERRGRPAGRRARGQITVGDGGLGVLLEAWRMVGVMRVGRRRADRAGRRSAPRRCAGRGAHGPCDGGGPRGSSGSRDRRW